MSSNIVFEQKLTGLHKVIGMAVPLTSEFTPIVAVEAFIKTLEVHPDWKFKIIGFGNLYSKIQAYIKEQSLQNSVLLYGPVEVSEMYDILKRSDIILLPSPSEEKLDKKMLGIGTPIIIHESHRLINHTDIDNSLITYDGTVQNMTSSMNQTIAEINNYDSAALRTNRLAYVT